MSAGPSSYVPMPPMLGPGSMSGHSSGMQMPPTMVDMTGKQTPTHMGGPPIRGTPERKPRGQAPAAAAAGPTKRQPRMPRSSSTRASSIQAQTPTAPPMYPTPAPQTPHSMYPQPSYNPNQWMQPQNVPGSQPAPPPPPQPQQQQPQPTMIPTYPNTQTLKQPFMSTVRPTNMMPNRSNVSYTNPSMPQTQQTQPQSQGQPTQIPVGYMNDPTSMMVSSTTANTMPPNANRQQLPPTAVKRKLNETSMYTNEAAQYTTPTAKMPLQTNGII